MFRDLERMYGLEVTRPLNRNDMRIVAHVYCKILNMIEGVI